MPTKEKGIAGRRGRRWQPAVPVEVLEERVLLASSGAPQDLVGYFQGNWTVGVSNGATAFTTTQWAAWANIAWDFLGQGDFSGDGLTDVVGLNDGAWWVGVSTGTNFVTTRWTTWSNTNWTEIRLADLNADNRIDIVARTGNQYWAALSTATNFAAPTVWANAGGFIWDATLLDDVNDDNRADLIVLLDGTWRVATSIIDPVTLQPRFGSANIWATWIDANYALTTADMNFDGSADIVGFLNGAWYVGYSNEFNSFGGQNLVASWSNVSWKDVRVGDFNGDTRGDFAGRNGGNWWVSTLNANLVSVTTSLWTSWSNINWLDVRVGDFDGDGKDDIAGREGGNWWVARANATGTAFLNTTLWAQWQMVAWQAAATIQANNFPPASGSGGLSREESLPLFWSLTKKDDDFAWALLAPAI